MMLGSGFFDVNCHVTWSLAGGAHDFTLEDPNPYISPMEIESMIHCWKQASIQQIKLLYLVDSGCVVGISYIFESK
jgi:hypothetical protein